MINKTMQLDVHVNLNIGGLSTKYISGKKYGWLYKHAQTAIIKDAVMRIQSGGALSLYQPGREKRPRICQRGDYAGHKCIAHPV